MNEDEKKRNNNQQHNTHHTDNDLEWRSNESKWVNKMDNNYTVQISNATNKKYFLIIGSALIEKLIDGSII